MKVIHLLYIVVLTIDILSAETFLLNDGTYVNGKLISESDESITVKDNAGEARVLPRADLQRRIPEEDDDILKKVDNSFRKSPITSFSASMQAGWAGIDLTALNNEIASRGYQPFSEDYFALGLSAQFSISRWVLGAQGSFLLSKDRKQFIGASNLRSSFNAGSFVARAGFKVFDLKYFEMVPYVNFGGAVMQLTTVNTDSDSFGNVLSSGGRASELAALSFISGAGLELNAKIPIDRRFGFLAGIRGGYNQAFAQGEWNENSGVANNDISHGPSALLTGPYAQLNSGIYYRFD